MFQHKCLVSEEVILKTENDIRLKLTSLDQVENSSRNWKICLEWNVPSKTFSSSR